MLIAQIVFDQFTDIDVFLAWDLLNRVRRPDWTVRLLGTEAQHTSLSGLTIPMHGRIEEAAQADAVLFASGPATRTLRLDRDYLARFRLDPKKQIIGSMCSGALLLAALGLLAAALAGPSIRSDFFNRFDTPTPRTTVILIDASGSMGVKASGRTATDAARGWASRFLDQLRPGDRVALFAVKGDVVPLVAPPNNTAAYRMPMTGLPSACAAEGDSPMARN